MHAALRVNGVVNIFICRQSAKLSQELSDPNEGCCVSESNVGVLLGCALTLFVENCW